MCVCICVHDVMYLGGFLMIFALIVFFAVVEGLELFPWRIGDYDPLDCHVISIVTG